MSSSVIAAKEPAQVTLEAGKTYAWCVCGLSTKQPFCDGSHKSTALKPLVFKQEAAAEAWLCRCKQTKNGPFCDGTHNTL
jgi:CDGSH-type Zn-finger protein